jgi:hypothetical protein
MRTLITMISISFLLFFTMIGLSGCFQDDQTEGPYTGVWKVSYFSDDHNNQTTTYLESHRNYSLYVKPDHGFVENWTEESNPQVVTGTWHITNGGKRLLLTDAQNGERVYEFQYMYTLCLKSGNKELVLRKV